MKFIAGRAEKNQGERESGLRQVPRSRSIFLWLPDGTPEQQREDGEFRQVGAFAKEIMNFLNAGLGHLWKQPVQQRLKKYRGMVGGLGVARRDENHGHPDEQW